MPENKIIKEDSTYTTERSIWESPFDEGQKRTIWENPDLRTQNRRNFTILVGKFPTETFKASMFLIIAYLLSVQPLLSSLWFMPMRGNHISLKTSPPSFSITTPKEDQYKLKQHCYLFSIIWCYFVSLNTLNNQFRHLVTPPSFRYNPFHNSIRLSWRHRLPLG